MSKATIKSIPATPTPETSGDSAGSASPPLHLDGSEREAQQRYNPIELLSWARSVIKYSDIRGDLSDEAGIICCWQDYVLDAFHAELEAMKTEGDLHLYGLEKPETLAYIEKKILQEVATIVREDIHRRLHAQKENQARRVTRANTAAAAAAAKEKRLRRRLVLVYLQDGQDETLACKKSRSKKIKKIKTTQRTDGHASSHVPQTNAVGCTSITASHTDGPKGEKEQKDFLEPHPHKIDLGVFTGEVKGYTTKLQAKNERPIATKLPVASIAAQLIIENGPATLEKGE